MKTVLELDRLHAWYGESHVLHGVDLCVAEGEVVVLAGRNGAGRTSTLRAIMGLTGRRSGAVRVNGIESLDLPPHRVARLGVGYCPEERGIFSSLTVHENLLLPPSVDAAAGWSMARLYAAFPNLRERSACQGTQLSGGEQQMLAVARILRTGARLLLLDEISEGLAPVIVEALGRMVGMLKREGCTVLLVEQNFHFAAPLADRFCLMEHGRITRQITRAELPGQMAQLHEALGV